MKETIQSQLHEVSALASVQHNITLTPSSNQKVDAQHRTHYLGWEKNLPSTQAGNSIYQKKKKEAKTPLVSVPITIH